MNSSELLGKTEQWRFFKRQIMYANCQGPEDTANPYKSQGSLTLIKRNYYLFTRAIHLNVLLDFTNKIRFACSSIFLWSSCELLRCTPGIYEKKNKSYPTKKSLWLKLLNKMIFFAYKLIACWSAVFIHKVSKDDNVRKVLSLNVDTVAS